MRRDSENSSYLIDLKLPGFQELRLLRGDGDGRVFQPFFQNGDLAAVGGAAELAHPGLTDPLRVFDRSGVFQDAGRGRPVGEELAAVFFRGDGKADGVLGHRYRRVADKPVEAEAGDVQHIRGKQYDRFVFAPGFIRGPLVLVVQLTVLRTVDGHLVRHQRIEGDDLAPPVADDLRVGVSPQKQMCHQRFPEYEGTHLRVRLVVQYEIQRMVYSLFFTAIRLISVEVQRQSRYRLRQYADAGVHRRHLHCGTFRYGLSGQSAAHEEGIA